MTRMILAAAITTAFTAGLLGQTAATKPLPLENLGLEHLDIIVPDPAASARFYTRLFKSALHQQPVRDTLRTSCCLATFRPIDKWVTLPSARRVDGPRPSAITVC